MAQPEFVTTAFSTTAAAKLALARVRDAMFSAGYASPEGRWNAERAARWDTELAAAHAAVQAAERAEDAALSRWARERRTGLATW